MEYELEPLPPRIDRGWRRSVVALTLLIVLVVSAQIFGSHSRSKGSLAGDTERSQALTSGDFYMRLTQAYPSASIRAGVLRLYRKSLPWPSAYRRLGVIEQSEGKSGLDYFEKMDSREATKGMKPTQIAKLRREKSMWLKIFAARNLTPQESRGYVSRIRSLNLGPLKSTAVELIYQRSGQIRQARAVKATARHDAIVSVATVGLLLSVLFVGGLGGLIAAILFLNGSARRFASAENVPLEGSMLLSAFIVYLGSYIGFGGLIEVLSDFAGFSLAGNASSIWYVVLLILSAAAAYVLGMLTLVGRARILSQDWRQIGYRTRNASSDALSGVVGFFSSLPFVFVAAIVAAMLNKTIFRHFPTPEQPFGAIVSTGSFLEVLLVLIAASVVAPIIEETFFRGVLFTAFRTKLPVWPSVLLTSAVFAIIHPLPGGFLPIFTLACVLALLRERSGSVLPGIVCHSVYNTIVLVVAALFG